MVKKMMLLAGILLLLTGCSEKESEPVFSQETPPKDLVISTEDKNQYEFVDVNGEETV